MANTFTFRVKATNAAGNVTSPSVDIVIAPSTVVGPTIQNASPPSGAQGVPYSYAFSATGQPAPTFAIASGSPPPGLSLGTDGVLAGTPTTPGSSTFTVSASNSGGTVTSPSLVVEISGIAPSFTAADPPDGSEGVPYSYTFVASGSPAPTFTVESGTVPSGLTLSPDGSLAGTPDTAATSTFTVTAANSADSVTTPMIDIVIGGSAVSPGAPTSVAATSGENGKSTITWTAPSDGGSPITSYDVQRVDNAQTVSSGGSPFLWSGLTNGTTYQFQVRACSNAGCGAWSTPASGKPYTVPGTVARPTGSSQNNAIRLSWSAPSSSGSAITRYEYRGGKSGQTSSTAVTLEFGQDGGQKTFDVRACNAAGCGGWSASSSPDRAKVIAVARGASNGSGIYWYDTKVYGVPGASMTLSCQDGTSRDWYSQAVTLDSSGYYRDTTLCYSGDADPHWVTSGSLSSNKVNF